MYKRILAIIFIIFFMLAGCQASFRTQPSQSDASISSPSPTQSSLEKTRKPEIKTTPSDKAATKPSGINIDTGLKI